MIISLTFCQQENYCIVALTWYKIMFSFRSKQSTNFPRSIGSLWNLIKCGVPSSMNWTTIVCTTKSTFPTSRSDSRSAWADTWPTVTVKSTGFKAFRVNDSRNPKTCHFWSTRDCEILVNELHLWSTLTWYVEKLIAHFSFFQLAISRRKMEMPIEKVIMAVNALDLKVLSLENVELLQRMVPTDQEVRLFYV